MRRHSHAEVAGDSGNDHNTGEIRVVVEDPGKATHPDDWKYHVGDLLLLVVRDKSQVDELTNAEYIKSIKGMGINVSLIAKRSANLSETRFKLLDWIVEEEISQDKNSLDNSAKICDTTRYKSCKMLFSKNKKYSSRAAWSAQVECHEDQLIIDEPAFWNEADYFKLYNINDE